MTSTMSLEFLIVTVHDPVGTLELLKQLRAPPHAGRRG